MKKHTTSYPILTFFKLLTDLMGIPLIFILAYGFKFKVGWIFHRIFLIPFGNIYEHAQVEPYINATLIVMLLWVIAFYFSGMYRPASGLMPQVDGVIAVIKGVSLGTLELMAVSFVDRAIPESRFVIFYAWGLGLLWFSLSRHLFYQIEVKMIRSGLGVESAVVIGTDQVAQDICERLFLYPTLRLHYRGTLGDTVPEKLHFHLRGRFKLLGGSCDFEKLLTVQAKVVFLTQLDYPKESLQALTVFCEKHRIELRILSELSFGYFGKTHALDFDGFPFVAREGTLATLPQFQKALKRSADISLSLMIVFLVSPIMLLTALFIKLSSPNGPIFYAQKRVGYQEKPFFMLKFRTMVPDAEAKTGPVMVHEKNETRYIPLGKWLRRLSIDELPQFFNVLAGDMSIVGPRPERPFFVEKFSTLYPAYALRHQIKGGITGWAQVNGRSVLTHRPDQKAAYDLYYIYHWSLLFDLKILFKTLLVVFKQEEAY